MRLESVLEKDKHWSGVVSTAAPVATGTASAWRFLSELNQRTANQNKGQCLEDRRSGDEQVRLCDHHAITRGSF